MRDRVLLDDTTRDRLLLDLSAQVAALRRDMAVLIRSAGGTADPLLEAIFGAIGGTGFLAAELFARAAIDRRLGHALEQARVTSVVGLSRRLSRLFRRPGPRLRLEKAGREARGVLWAIVDVTQADALG